MPKKPQILKYRDLIFPVSISKHTRKFKNGNETSFYRAELRCERNGLVLLRRSAQKKEKQDLEAYLQDTVLPEMYYQVARLRKENDDVDDDYIRIGLFWEMFRNDIADRYHWNSTTLKKKETKLDRVLLNLLEKPLKDLTIDDYMAAVELAIEQSKEVTGIVATDYTDTKEETQGEDAKESTKESDALAWKAKCEYYVLLSKLTNTAFMRGICHTDPLAGIVELIRPDRKPEALIFDHFHVNHLSETQQRILYQEICDQLDNEGLYIGLALMLFAGLSVEECCALRESDILKLGIFPDIKCIRIIKACRQIKTKNGKTELVDDELLRSVNNYRLIPLHPYLRTLLDEKIKLSEQRMQSATRDVYLVTKQKNASAQVSPTELGKFYRDLLIKHDIKQEIVLPALPRKKERRVACVTPSILQDNFCYQLRTHGMTDDEVRYLAGKAMLTTASNHYRDWASDYTQLALQRKMCRWHFDDVRASSYSDTEEYDVLADTKNSFKTLLDGQPTTLCLAITNTGANGITTSCKVKVRINASGGFFGQCAVRDTTDAMENALTEADHDEDSIGIGCIDNTPHLIIDLPEGEE